MVPTKLPPHSHLHGTAATQVPMGLRLHGTAATQVPLGSRPYGTARTQVLQAQATVFTQPKATGVSPMENNSKWVTI